MGTRIPMYLAGDWAESDMELDVTNPYDGSVVGTTFLASKDQLETAIVAAEGWTSRKTPTYDRVDLLKAFAETPEAQRRGGAPDRTRSGQAIREAEVETDRGVFTIETAAEEAKRITGEVIPLDLLPSSKGRFGIVRRFAIGPIAGISPFNFPLNLALHKVAPALASGNPIVIKPPSRDPLTMLKMAEFLHDIGLPKGLVSVLPMDREVGDALVADERFKLLSFTRSPEIGWAMKLRAGMKRSSSNSAATPAWSSTRTPTSISPLPASHGRVRVRGSSLYLRAAEFHPREGLRRVPREAGRADGGHQDRRSARPHDRPRADDRRQCSGPQPAVGRAGGRRRGDGRDWWHEGYAISADNHRECEGDLIRLFREAFAPMVTLFKVPTFGKAIARLNDSVYGLQAGVFTEFAGESPGRIRGD